MKASCKIEGCNKMYKCKKLCSMHYDRLYRNGDPNVLKTERHGKYGTREYKTWAEMKSRCNNKKSTGYKNYGGRGISVCERWTLSFLDFYEDMGDRPIGFSIDRIDNDGNYEPSNCKWSNRKTQRNNQRISSLNTSGEIGVSYNKKCKKWIAKILRNKQVVFCKEFKEKQEAITAVRLARKKLDK